MIDSKLEDNTFFAVLHFLSPNEILIVQECSRRWFLCGNSSVLWSHYLNTLWKQIDYEPQPTLLDKIADEIPLSMIIENLDLNIHYDESKIKNDLDYFRLCQARLLFRHLKSGEKLPVPGWSFKINLYKVSYYFSKYEMRRDTFLESEVVSPYTWRCNFKHSLEDEYGWDCEFLDDGQLVSSIHDTPMSWKFTSYNFFDGCVAKMIIDEYPPLKMDRKNGVLTVENLYVVMKRNERIESLRNSPII